MKYLVVAKKWDNEKEEIVNFVAGMFNDITIASIFKRAYNDEFSANSKVVETEKLINPF